MPKLKVRFDDPEHGWIGLFIEYDGQIQQYNASYAGSNSFPQLTTALLSLTEYQGSYLVEWYYNPDQLHMIFTRVDEQICLVVNHHSDPYDAPQRVHEWLSICGTYDEVCLPFWRALRVLQGRYSEQEWEKRFRGPFPYAELDLLTHQLGKD